MNQHRARQQNLTKDDINLLKNQISKNLEHQDRAESEFIKAEQEYETFVRLQRAQAKSNRTTAEGYRDTQLQRFRKI